MQDTNGVLVQGHVGTNAITLLATPIENAKVSVMKKVGQSWTSSGTTLGNTENGIARFLRAGTSELPE